MFARLMGVQSNRETDRFRDNAFLLDSLCRLTGSSSETLPHSDTVKYLLERLDPSQLEAVRTKMVKRLMRQKQLDFMKTEGMWMVAVDGVHLFSRHAPLPHSTHRTHSTGVTDYMSVVLEAKLVSRQGMVVSLGSVSVENVEGDYDKQDCELKAFSRLAERLKKEYPHLKICLLLDGLYLTRNVIEVCRRNGWDYSITFKEGEAKAFFREAMKRIGENRHNRIEDIDPVSGMTRKISWCNGLEYDLGDTGKKLEASVVRMKRKDRKVLMYLTSLRLSHKNVIAVGDGVCRQRWKIENKGFNCQKNGGLALGKAFGTRHNAAYNFYLVVQLAHILLEIITHSTLFRRLQCHLHPEKIPRTIQEPPSRFYRSVRAIMAEIRDGLLHEYLLGLDLSDWRLAFIFENTA